MDLKTNGQNDLKIIRPKANSDIPQVVEIERKVTFHPSTQNAFSESLKAGYKCWFIDSDDPFITYLVQSIDTEESRILNLAAKSTRQDQGVGRDLVNKVCIDAAKNGVMKILLEIRPNNLIAR